MNPTPVSWLARLFAGAELTHAAAEISRQEQLRQDAQATLDQVKARLDAVEAELEVRTKIMNVTSIVSEADKKGDIVSSDPPAGESVKPGTKVAVVVSKGPEPVTMPSLDGTDGDAAEATLTDLGLEVDRSNKTSESVAKGLVIRTNPEGGATTFRGETVELVVSKGPPLVVVPNVVGKGEDEARAELEDAGFTVSVNKPLVVAIFGVNSQNPRGGTKAPKGSTVTITVV